MLGIEAIEKNEILIKEMINQNFSGESRPNIIRMLPPLILKKTH